MNIESVAVFCSSKTGTKPIYMQHAAEIGKLIAALNLKLIYGGGNIGLMGALANSAIQHGGQIIGVIPKLLLEWEHKHEGLTELAVVPDMHARKKTIYDLCDAAIVLPGGFGTLDELFEMLTWNQLKIHDKKIYILNSGNFYHHLIQHLQMLQKEDMLYEELSDRIVICQTPVEIFNKIG
ncbi:MAG: TIGR00730 family Rossman fold protein [Chitinophagaceae bacterium]|nr:TIGR00730 family Rossman fold protein [Chitinophagaceae bacterium]